MQDTPTVPYPPSLPHPRAPGQGGLAIRADRTSAALTAPAREHRYTSLQ